MWAVARAAAPAERRWVSHLLLGSTPDIYTQEWASFTTQAFPDNRLARSGDPVRIVMKDVAHERPVVDLVWFHEDYVNLFAAAKLEVVGLYAPLGRRDVPHAWLSETSLAPWVIYVVTKKRSG